MNLFAEFISSAFLFISLYFEVFLLISIFEDKTEKQTPSNFNPLIDIIVPVFNEEKTIPKTLDSLLNLSYDQSKINIVVINDGSIDGTSKILEQYSKYPNIQIFNKSNEGKYKALNFAIEKSTAQIIGCLDADSIVEKDALSKIIARFEDQSVFAVTPAMIIENPDNTIRKMQKAEYHYGNFIRKAFSSLGAIHITPGPFSFFRKEVFDIVGLYKHAHNTEDMEMAMRLQKHHLKIVNEPNAVVYTTGPGTIKTLYRQRVRWVGGFLGNLLDYKFMLFNKKFGNLGLFVLPIASFGILFTTIFIAQEIIKNIISLSRIVQEIYITRSINFSPSFEWFYIDTSTTSLIAIFLLLITLFMTLWGEKLSTGKIKLGPDVLYFMFFYGLLSPFWLCKAIYNNIRSKDAPWR